MSPYGRTVWPGGSCLRLASVILKNHMPCKKQGVIQVCQVHSICAPWRGMHCRTRWQRRTLTSSKIPLWFETSPFRGKRVVDKTAEPMKSFSVTSPFREGQSARPLSVGCGVSRRTGRLWIETLEPSPYLDMIRFLMVPKNIGISTNPE